jgi:hypothetical protein
MKIVGDKLVWKDESNKKQGYDLRDGRSTHKTRVMDVTVSRGNPKKNNSVRVKTVLNYSVTTGRRKFLLHGPWLGLYASMKGEVGSPTIGAFKPKALRTRLVFVH